jgi:hypothetical protein
LSEYEVILNISNKSFFPFDKWKNGTELPWYSDYNSVKHNRSGQFCKASLGNVITAVASAFVTLFAQFYTLSFDPYQNTTSWDGDVRGNGFLNGSNTLFRIKMPTWPTSEMYNFNQPTLPLQSSDLDVYPF